MFKGRLNLRERWTLPDLNISIAFWLSINVIIESRNHRFPWHRIVRIWWMTKRPICAMSLWSRPLLLVINKLYSAGFESKQIIPAIAIYCCAEQPCQRLRV